MNPGADANLRCLVLAAADGDATARRGRGQVRRHLVRPAVEPLGYDVTAAGEFVEPGRITHQLLERGIADDLVVCDLTGGDPAVFYVLALRHATGRPVVALLAAGDVTPFAPEDVRPVTYDLHDPDLLEGAREELADEVIAIEEARGRPRNPVAVARDAVLLQRGDGEDLRATGAVLEELRALRSRGRRFARGARPPAPVDQVEGPADHPVDRLLADILADQGPLTEAALVEEVYVRTGRNTLDIRPALRELSRDGRAAWNADSGRWSAADD